MICSLSVGFDEYPVMGGVADEVHTGSLFFAVVPNPDAAARIYRLAEAIKCARQFRGGLTDRDSLHITLFFLGDMSGLSERSVRMAFEAAAEVKTEPFEISFDRSSSFRGQPGYHPFVLLGGDGLNRLRSFRRTLGAAMMRNGLKQRVKVDFNPHVTLLYDARKVEEQPIEPISWTVGEFVLIHSKHGHAHLARWPLQAVPQ